MGLSLEVASVNWIETTYNLVVGNFIDGYDDWSFNPAELAERREVWDVGNEIRDTFEAVNAFSLGQGSN